MPYAEECQTPIWINPIEILNLDFAPSIICSSNAINSFIRGTILVFILSLLFFIYTKNINIFIFGLVIITALYTPSLYKTIGAPWTTEKKIDVQTKEGFQGDILKEDILKEDILKVENSNQSKETLPTKNNPFMNTLIDELKYNPTRPCAININNAESKTEFDDFFRVQWFSDPTDVFGKSQSQRQFYTMPSTSVPNDQGSFQDWLYKIPGKTCKEGGKCYPGTDGGKLQFDE